MKILTETVVDVDEEVTQKLATSLSLYHELKAQRDVIDEAMAIETKAMMAEMELIGVDKLHIEGTPCTIVRGKSSKLDKLLFVKLGGSLKTLEDATTSKPKKPYLRIGAEKSDD